MRKSRLPAKKQQQSWFRRLRQRVRWLGHLHHPLSWVVILLEIWLMSQTASWTLGPSPLKDDLLYRQSQPSYLLPHTQFA